MDDVPVGAERGCPEVAGLDPTLQPREIGVRHASEGRPTGRGQLRSRGLEEASQLGFGIGTESETRRAACCASSTPGRAPWPSPCRRADSARSTLARDAFDPCARSTAARMRCRNSQLASGSLLLMPCSGALERRRSDVPEAPRLQVGELPPVGVILRPPSVVMPASQATRSRSAVVSVSPDVDREGRPWRSARELALDAEQWAIRVRSDRGARRYRLPDLAVWLHASKPSIESDESPQVKQS